MKKINNIKLNSKLNTTLYALGILALLALSIMMLPVKASAQSVIHPYGSTQNLWPTLGENQNYNQNYNQTYNQNYNYRPQPAQNQNQNTAAVVYYNPSANQTSKTTVVKTQTQPNTQVTYTYVYDSRTAPSTVQTTNTIPAETTVTNATTTENQQATEVASKSTYDYAAVTANAIFGSNGAYPSGLVQWIIFGILILLIVILVRKIFGGDQRYLSTPLKHA